MISEDGSESAVTVTITGTWDSRKSKLMTTELYGRMVEEAERIINKDFGLSWNRVKLVSGGAAWAGMSAVLLYLR